MRILTLIRLDRVMDVSALTDVPNLNLFFNLPKIPSDKLP